MEPIWYNDASDWLINRINYSPAEIIILTGLWEAVPTIDWQHRYHHFISKLKSSRPQSKIIVILNSFYKNDVDLLQSQYVDDLVFVDFFLFRCYIEILKLKKTTLTTWNKTDNKFLFLTGKPEKKHRIGLLYKFYKAGLLSQAIWSLFLPEVVTPLCKELLKIDSDEYQSFIEKCTSNPDNIDMVYMPDGLHYGGIPYEAFLFAETKFQVISETHFHIDWITEKTWISILNRKPFIMASGPGTLYRLKQLGFHTFDQYLAVDYDNEPDHEYRSNEIVKNTQHWLENLDYDSVEPLVEHNYQQAIKMAKKNFQILQSIISKYELIATVSDLVPTEDELAKKHTKSKN